MEDRTLILKGDDGKDIVAQILFTYHSDEFGKDYVVFFVPSDNKVSAACYNPADGKEGMLMDIKTDEEWAMLQDLLDDYTNSDDEEEGCDCGGSCEGCGGSCGGCKGSEEA